MLCINLVSAIDMTLQHENDIIFIIKLQNTTINTIDSDFSINFFLKIKVLAYCN